MPFHEKGDVRIYYEEAGSGFPLLLIPGGGLNSTISFVTDKGPVQRDGGVQGRVPLHHDGPAQRQWRPVLRPAGDRPAVGRVHADDQLRLMDHLGIKAFLVMGFCIGGPFIWNLLRRAPERIVAAVLAQPSGFRPEMPDLFYQNNIKGWGPGLCERTMLYCG